MRLKPFLIPSRISDRFGWLIGSNWHQDWYFSDVLTRGGTRHLAGSAEALVRIGGWVNLQPSPKGHSPLYFLNSLHSSA